MTSTFLGYQLYANNMSRSLANVAAEGSVSSAKDYYAANIGKVKSVDDFIGNYRLFSYAMQAAGLSDMTYAKGFMRKVLTSDLTDASSFANKLTDPRFKTFASYFSFGTDGKAGGIAASAQNAGQEAKTIQLYTAKVGADSIDAITQTAYYEAHVGSVKTVQDLMNDSQLLDYVMTAYGLDSNTLKNGTLAKSTAAAGDLAAVLESDPSDPNSVASQMAAGGADSSNIAVVVQSSAQIAATSAAYTDTYGRTTDLIYYENQMNNGKVHSVDAFLADATLVSVAEKAYGIDGAGYTTSDLKKILTSDLGNPMSVAKQLGRAATAFANAFNATASSTSPYQALAQDFNFDAAGKVATARSAQSTLSMASTEALYKARVAIDATSQATAAAESTYFISTMSSITRIDDLLGDSRLLSYLKQAYGLPAGTPADTLRKVLTSDLSDPNSPANKLGTAYRQLAAALNFSTSGTIDRTGGSAQSAKSAQVLNDSFLQQTLEDEAGKTSEGVKLALYFQRKAPTLTSVYSILADSALLKVVQTALNIPASTSGQDIDTQAARLTQRLNIQDLKDPAKLKRFISQFANLYDLADATASNGSTATALFGNGG